MQKMAELLGLRDECEEGTVGAPALAGSCLADNRLNLDVYPDGCHRFLQLFKEQQGEVVQVEFLRLSSNDCLLDTTLGSLPHLKHLKSLVLKGGLARDEFGSYQHGSLTSLPPDFGNLRCLTHLDLSFNRLSTLPSCILHLPSLRVLLVSHNSLVTLPEDFGCLSKLTFFSAMKNQLKDLPQSIGELSMLQDLDLSENALELLPEEVGNLHNCTELDLSGNRLLSIPESLANLKSLRRLHLHSNLLVTVPASLASLPNLSRLDLQNNCLRAIPAEIQTLPFVHVRGNPLGETEPSPQADKSSTGRLKRFFLASGEGSFTVTSEGCRVVLACGIHFYFPPGAASDPLRIHFRSFTPDPQWVKLRHHDVLLSRVLELQPHGVQFQQEVQIWMPYVSPQTPHQHEVVVRTFSGQSWTDLKARVKQKRKSEKCVAHCCVLHFSWFLVVSRLVQNECKVPAEGTLLFSSVDPNIKVIFPPGVTKEPRSVKLQVLPVSAEEIEEITAHAGCRASPLLYLSQDSTVDFLKPVRIQLPLPPRVTGLNLDRSRLHILHGDLEGQIWNDITSEVVLEFTHLYAVFEVTHFSWYWLWYTTKTYIGGIAKKVYERLRLYQVNFIALQKKRDPEQVLLQCVPKHKVDPVLKKLQDRYRGPEPSDMVEMFEGEQFFAAFERGISIDMDRPDCVDGRLSFIFYSHLKNMKEIYVTSSVDRKGQAVKGQVSFYRGAIPESIPEDANKRRKGPDSLWLATLPIKLPQLKLRDENPGPLYGFSFPPLNLGNAETGYLTQANLLSIARRVGADWQSIGLNLGLTYQQIERIGYNNREDLNKQILDMLFSWAQQNSEDPDCVSKLITAMKESGRQDIADEVEAIIELGQQKYSESIRRLGLEQESSTEDSAIAMI
ncbi:p53-induced death domain-containing protein 1 [Vidua macroura]|nr:p53-induced death domain-containing protein 1 [Vidua macroura]